MDREQHLPYRAIGDVAVLEGDGSRLEREDVFPCLIWADGVPAPVDADGNVVPLTTRTLYDGDGHEIDVMEYALIYSKHTGVPVWRVRRSDGMIFMLSLFHLERPDSWERLSDDLGRYNDTKVMCEYFGMTADGTCDGCRAHSLLARHPGRSCIAFAFDDVVSRVRALRGEERDED